MSAIEAKGRTDRRRRPDNADEISARTSDRDAGQGTTDQKRERSSKDGRATSERKESETL